MSVYLGADEYFYYWHGWDLQHKWIRELYQNTSLVDRQPEAIWRGRVADDDYPERDALRSAHSSSLLHHSLLHYSLLHYSLPRTKSTSICTTYHMSLAAALLEKGFVYRVGEIIKSARHS